MCFVCVNIFIPYDTLSFSINEIITLDPFRHAHVNGIADGILDTTPRIQIAIPSAKFNLETSIYCIESKVGVQI